MNHDAEILCRPVHEDDIDRLYELAAAAPDPITTLPADRDYLAKRTHSSIRSFYPYIDSPGAESYLFVIENLTTGELLGTSAIFARIGGYEPFYTYEIRETTLEHQPMEVSKTIRELHLKLDHDGPSEIGSLYLSPQTRGMGLGRLLSLSRFLFIANFPERFADDIMVELRGVTDEDGQSPFWGAVGEHFFGCDYMTADHLSAKADKSFLSDLMPKHPIYVPLLPKKARKVLGKVHKNTRPALAMLEQEGFTFMNEIDIFDAGPAYSCAKTEVKSIQNSVTRSVTVGKVTPDKAQRALVSNTQLEFKCVKARIALTDDSVTITEATARALNLKDGDEARLLTY